MKNITIIRHLLTKLKTKQNSATEKVQAHLNQRPLFIALDPWSTVA